MDFATRKQVQTLYHEKFGFAAKYSLQGDRIATATKFEPVQVWDSSDGCLLLDIPADVTPYFNTGLLWFNHYLFLVSGGKIKEFDVSTGSVVSEWPIPNSNYHSCIALPDHEEFIAYAANFTIAFRDMSTHSQLDFIQHPEDIRSIAFSPDDRFLAFGGKDRKVIIKSLSRITVGAESRRVYHVSDPRSPLLRTSVAPP